MITCPWIVFKLSQRAWTPVSAKERIKASHCATPACAGVSQVNDAGALAPVVFSGDGDLKTCKIRNLKAKERSCPPISTLLNSMEASVSTESACTGRFEASQIPNPNNG